MWQTRTLYDAELHARYQLKRGSWVLQLVNQLVTAKTRNFSKRNILGAQPLTLMVPLAPQIEALLGSQIGTAQDFLGPEMISTLPDPEPELGVTPIEGLPGTGVALQGSGFTPGTGFHVLCGDEPVARTASR